MGGPDMMFEAVMLAAWICSGKGSLWIDAEIPLSGILFASLTSKSRLAMMHVDLLPLYPCGESRIISPSAAAGVRSMHSKATLFDSSGEFSNRRACDLSIFNCQLSIFLLPKVLTIDQQRAKFMDCSKICLKFRMVVIVGG